MLVVVPFDMKGLTTAPAADNDEDEDSSEGGVAATLATSQILAVWSAEQVASFLTSGDSSTRVMYSLCALKCVTGTSCVRS